MQLLQGDCFEVMQGLADNSVDLVLTDPPAGIGFMNCDWDKDKGGRDSWIKWMADIAAECLRVTKPGGHALVWALPRTSHWTATAWENGGWQPRDKIAHVFGTGFPKSHNGPWGGTALKPAMEDWWLLRKPLIGTVAANFAEYGTGALNIDGCRIGLDGGGTQCNNRDENGKCRGHKNAGRSTSGETFHGPNTSGGRWPANLLHDGSEEVLALFPMTKSGGGNKNPIKPSTFNVSPNHGRFDSLSIGCDSGSAARFFYCAKASKRERTDGNHHPTVKPIALMEYLVQLASRPGAVVLDPFMGSGTTGIACRNLGREFIGIEMNEEYMEIAKRRIGIQLAEDLF